MPQAIPAAVGWAVTAFTSAATVINTAFVAGAALIPGLSFSAQLAVANFATKALIYGGLAAGAAAIMRPSVPSSGVTLDFKPDPKAPIVGMMGYCATGGNKVFQATWGYKKVALSLGAALSLGPIDAITQFRADDAVVSFAGPQNEATGFFAADMWQRTTTGLPTDAALLPPTGLKYGNPPLTGWGANNAAPGVAFAFWTMVLAKNPEDRDIFVNGVPEPRWIGRWMKVYDWRKDSTYPGGDGPQREGDWRTWGYSENPYVHARAFLRGHYKLNTDGTLDYTKRIAGVGVPASAIDMAAFTEGANVADTNAWTISGSWSTSDQKWQVLVSMLQAGGGQPINRGAQVSVLINTPRVSTYTYTRDDMIGQAEVRPLTRRRERKNTIVPRYRSEAHNWEYVAADDVTATVYRTEDRGEPRSTEIQYTYVRSPKQAAQLAAYDLVTLREGLTITLPSKVHLMHVHAGDCITVNVPDMALSNQKVIVVRTTHDYKNATTTLECRSETDGKHAFALGQAAAPPPSPTLSRVDPYFVPAPLPADWAVVPKPPADGTSQPIFIIELPLDTTDIVSVIIKHATDPAGPWTDGYEGSPRTDGRYEVSGLVPGETYCLSLQYVARNGAKSEPNIKCGYVAPAFVAGDTTHVGGIPVDEIPALDTTPPADPTGLALSSSSTPDAAGNPYVRIEATWTANTDDDLSFYEVEITESGFTVIVPTATNRYSREALTGRTYAVRVRAVDKAGNRSGWTASQNIVGAGDTTPPAAPTAFTVATSLGAFFLSWTNPAASDVSKVEVWENTTNNSATATRIATVNATPSSRGGFTRSGLDMGSTRWYWLKAVDTSGNVSVFSGSGTGTLPNVTAGEIDTNPPGVPSALSLTTNTVIDAGTGQPRSRVVATWTGPSDSDLAGFEVEVTQAGGNPVIRVVGGPRDEWDARPNVSYTVRVRAFDRVGNKSAFTATQSIASSIDTTPPAVPTALSVTTSLGSAFLRWTNASSQDLDRVEVWENTTNNSATATRIATVNAIPSAAGGYTRSGLSAGDVRWYWLKSIDTSGNVSGFSTGSSATIPSVSVTDLASSIAAPEIFNTLALAGTPTQGRLVFIKADNKLYRGTGSAWTAEVQTVDLSGQITSTQITDGAISTPKLAANAVEADKIAGNAVTAGKIAANAVTAGTIAAAAVSTNELAANAITAEKIGAGEVTAGKLAANSVAANNIIGGTITGDKFNTGTSLPGTITVGSTGVSIGTVQSQAANPAGTINAGSTRIDPGLITISGSTTLSDWRRGGDLTKINGGAISANTIDANKLIIGLRGVAVAGLTFEANAGGVTNRLAWSSGSIAYVNDAGATTSVNISAGSYDWTSTGTTGGRQYVYWMQGSNTLSVTPANGTANLGVIIGVYTGGANWSPDYGRTIIDGDQIKTGAITANQLAAGAVVAGKLAAGAVVADSIAGGVITGDKFNTGTSLPGTITVGSTGVSIGTIQSQANDPAARINTGPATQITPGKIQISGGTTLADWRRGGDLTKIDGGAISANTINANQVTIGLRGVESTLTFTANSPGTNRVSWSSGTVNYINNAGTPVSASIPAGSTGVISNFPQAIGFSTTSGGLVFSTVATAQSFSDVIILAVYNGGTQLTTNYGRTVIDGDQIKTGAITADKITVTNLSSINANLGTITSGRVQNSANTTYLDLNNSRQQFQIGSYVWRQGNLGTGVLAWFGPSSIAIGSETRTNGAFAYGTDGKVYYGSSELGGESSGRKIINFSGRSTSGTSYTLLASGAVSNAKAGNIIQAEVLPPVFLISPSGSTTVGGFLQLWEQDSSGKSNIGSPVSFAANSGGIFDAKPMLGAATKSGSVTYGVDWRVDSPGTVNITNATGQVDITALRPL